MKSRNFSITAMDELLNAGVVNRIVNHRKYKAMVVTYPELAVVESFDGAFTQTRRSVDPKLFQEALDKSYFAAIPKSGHVQEMEFQVTEEGTRIHSKIKKNRRVMAHAEAELEEIRNFVPTGFNSD